MFLFFATLNGFLLIPVSFFPFLSPMLCSNHLQHLFAMIRAPGGASPLVVLAPSAGAKTAATYTLLGALPALWRQIAWISHVLFSIQSRDRSFATLGKTARRLTVIYCILMGGTPLPRIVSKSLSSVNKIGSPPAYPFWYFSDSCP